MDLVLNNKQVSTIKITIQEFREWDVLQANGLTPNHKHRIVSLQTYIPKWILSKKLY